VPAIYTKTLRRIAKVIPNKHVMEIEKNTPNTSRTSLYYFIYFSPGTHEHPCCTMETRETWIKKMTLHLNQTSQTTGLLSKLNQGFLIVYLYRNRGMPEH
jgi:hypothetical protein